MMRGIVVMEIPDRSGSVRKSLIYSDSHAMNLPSDYHLLINHTY